MRRIDAAINDRLDSWGNLHLVTPRIGCVVGIPTSAIPALLPAFDRLLDVHSSISPRTLPGRRKGAANPISTSLAYSLHANQCGSDCAVKNRALEGIPLETQGVRF